jgi:non-ribosomal peptide synthetase component F
MSRLRGSFGIEMPLRELFEAPVLADLAVRVEAAVRALLSGAAAPVPPLVRVSRQELLPLSFAQQRLWFIDQLAPGSPLYNMPVALRIEGPLDQAVLARCLGEIVRRHEALRTVFTVRDGAPVQRIQPAGPFAPPLVDLSGLPEKVRESTSLRLAGEEAGRAFDLACDPLLRCTLLQLDEENHVAALTLHHIASDGWSMDILVREVAGLYPAFAAGRPSPLPELPVQYADFAAWQRSWLQGEVLESQIAYWRRQLAGAPPLLRLPTDHPRPPVQTFRGGRIEAAVPAEMDAPLRQLCRGEQVTRFMALLAAYLVVLHRHSKETDLVVGAPIAYRHFPEIESLIGFFANTLVFRADLSADPSFRTLLGRVRRVALEAFAYQDVSFDKIVEELQPMRNPAYSPIFQVGFSFQQVGRREAPPEGLVLTPLETDSGTTQFELSLTVLDDGPQLLTSWYYNTDLFDARRIRRMADDFRQVLEAVTESPDLPLTALHERLAEAHRLAAAEKETERKQLSSKALGQIRRKTVATLS